MVKVYNSIMKLEKANKRDKKRNKRNKMVTTGKSVFIIQQVLIKRGDKKDGKDDK
jgi:hypothetical protein